MEDEIQEINNAELKNKIIKQEIDVLLNKQNRLQRTIEAKNLVLTLSKTNLSIKEQEYEFYKKTNMGRANFFRYRKALGLICFEYGDCKLGKNYRGCLDAKCYFCGKFNIITHHIDGDHNHNNIENLLYLCHSCHNKLHRIYANLKIEIKNI